MEGYTILAQALKQQVLLIDDLFYAIQIYESEQYILIIISSYRVSNTCLVLSEFLWWKWHRLHKQLE